jgi:hypothetical protein
MIWNIPETISYLSKMITLRPGDLIMSGTPDVPYPLGQHYVYVGFADTPDQVPDAVRGRIALSVRGSTVDADASGTGLFAHKAAEAAAKGAVALLIFNNVEGELEATAVYASTIPVFGVSKANGEYLRDVLGFQFAGFNADDPATWATISKFPIRINPPAPASFVAKTTGFSSRGPIDDFRFLKPDITAPGLSIYGATIAAGGVNTGGGIYTFGFGSTMLFNTIVAQNGRVDAAGFIISDDLSGQNVEADSAHNLVGDAATAGGLPHGGANGNIVGNSGAGTIRGIRSNGKIRSIPSSWP